RLARQVENLAERRAGAARITMVELGVREQHSEADLLELVSAAPRILEKAPEEGEGFVVPALARVALTEDVRGDRSVCRAEHSRVQGLLQETDRVRDIAAMQGNPSKPEQGLCEGCRRLGVRARRLVELGGPLLV